MRTDRVFTNLTCNQNCTYCTSRKPSEDRRFVARAAVVARIDDAIARGAKEIVLSGGEPALRNDLPSLVTHARGVRGERAERVVLETNATLIDAPRARALAEAGLAVARVNLAGWGDALDELTRDEGGFARTIEGLRELAAAGVPIEIAVTLVRQALPLLAALPAGLVATLGDRGVRAIVVTTPVESPDPSELISYEAAVRAIIALDTAARAVGIPVRLSPDSGPPPCLLPPKGKIAHVFSMTRGATAREDHTRIEACASCQIADRCSGFATAYLAHFAADGRGSGSASGPAPLHPYPAARPITEDRLRRRLSLVSTVEEQIRREMVTHNRATLSGYGEIEEHVVRVNFHCNQTCRFCFVSTHLPPPEEDAVRAAILDAGARGARIVLSGGEPTLNAKLPEYIALAVQSSRFPVEMQSNAVQLDDAALLDRLVVAGLEQVFVSLHGATAETSDEVTGAPGTFARTVVGLDNLERTKLRLILNFVICETNYRELVPFIRMVGERWKRAWVNLSFVAPSTDVVPRDRAMIPRYSDVMPSIIEAIGEAQRLSVQVMGFESMCGVPLCLVPTTIERYFSMSLIPEGFDGGEFTRPPACTDCGLNKRCYGLRRGYAELHGSSELKAVRSKETVTAEATP